MPSTVAVLGSFADSLIRFRGRLISDLVRRGHRVIACAPSIDPSVAVALRGMGAEFRDIPMQRAGMNPIADLRTLYALVRLFRDVRPDYLFAYTIKPVVYGTIAAQLARVPRRFAMITGLGFAFTRGTGLLRRISGMGARALYRYALSLCNGVFFQNADDLQLMIDEGVLGDPAKAAIVNGSGIDVDEFVYVAPPSRPDFLMIARLVRDKGVREYVEAARIVKVRCPQARFRLIGWIDENPSAISNAELNSWICDGTIDFLGRTDDVRPSLAECAVYVLPSYREGTPRTVLEAMAIGRAIITTDAPGCRETVIANENGILVPVADPAALADAMLMFIHQPELVGRFGVRSRQIAEAKYDVRLVNEALLRGMGL